MFLLKSLHGIAEVVDSGLTTSTGPCMSLREYDLMQLSSFIREIGLTILNTLRMIQVCWNSYGMSGM